MEFIVEKCKVLGLGHRSECLYHALNGTHFKRVRDESDLGVIVCGDLKITRQCGKAAVRANQVLGMIHRTFSIKKIGVMMKLYMALVRPDLEYCVPAWRPHLRGDVDRLERVQRRATKRLEVLME